MSQQAIFVVIFSTISIILLAIILFFLYKSKQNNSKGNLLIRNSNNKKKFFRIGEQEYSTYYFPGANNSPPFFQIEMNGSFDAKFKITKENSFDRFCKKIGLTSEMRTNDIDFDRKFYVNTDYPNYMNHLLVSSEIRSLISLIFEVGFNRIECDKKGLRAVIKPAKRKFKMEQPTIEQVAEKLLIIKNKCEKVHCEEEIIPYWKTKRVVIFSVSFMSFIVGMVLLIIGQVNYKVLDGGRFVLFSMKYSLIAFLLFLYISFLGLKGRSSSHNELLVVLFISLFGFFLFGWGATSITNGAQDNSAQIIHSQIVYKKDYHTNKNSKSYYAYVESWRGKKYEKIRISHATYRKIKPNSILSIATKSGRFNFEWLVDYWIEEADK